ncbi:hypothetical protein FNO01nite_07020 [Flavobacterium noncentrifugens]|uniref:Uncharacterized protein n=1 Tax=Flavobacterium noncentrifugens TaxID=1128970 RepID=A0A1G8SZL3_9FLAO|nr:hypothetical protein [Flavobacterium noncentrifugens]GEP50030.1 hypothetical protein FNO01nite_07020 [Flavobacterium noncentrifugens]SDJ34712.1 hypothetical protein SAMN04487935_0765 [Flavobacterium noncentrifugens]
MKKFLETIREYSEKNPKAFKALAALSFFGSLFVLSPLLNVVLQFRPAIKDFSQHVISNGTIYNYDVSSRIKTYYGSIISVIAVSGLLFSGLFIYFRKKIADSVFSQKSLELVFNLSLVGMMSVFAGFFLINADVAVYIVFFLAVYTLFHTKADRANSDEDGFWILSVSIPFAMLLFEWFQKKIQTGFFSVDLVVSNVTIPFSTKNIFFFLLFVLVNMAASIFLRWFLGKENDSQIALKRMTLFAATIPLAGIVAVQSLGLEFFNILNVRTGYVFDSPKLLFAVVAVVAIGISLWRYFKLRGKEVVQTNVIARYFFPLLIVSLAFMIAQPWRVAGAQDEFFESANHGISVDHFFRYGSIPIIETFDAHMLSNEIFGFVYSFLNGYEPWSPFLYNSYADIFNYLLLFFLLRKLLDPKIALVVCLCFPMLDILNNYFIFTVFVALALLRLFKTRSTRAFYVYWISILLLSLYRLDLGFPSVIAGTAAYFIFNYIGKNTYELKKFVVTAAVTFGSALLLFAVLCLVKGINPLERLHEFVVVSMSNQNWTFENMGDQSTTVFRIVYYVLPLALIFLLAGLCLRTFLDRKYANEIMSNERSREAAILFVFFALAFYFNIPRGIVRHTLLMNIIVTFTSTIPIAVCCFIFIKKRTYNLMLFLFLIIGFSFLVKLNETSLKGKSQSLLAAAIGSQSFNEKFQEAYPFNGTRTKPQTDEKEIQYFKSLLDAVLKPDETYFDFSSHNYYFALTGRKNPLYVNQTPLMLNGDFSQQRALEEIKGKNISVVLMSDSTNMWRTIDEVSVDLKYYMLSEYVYHNFKPILKLKDIIMFVRKDKWETYKKQLNTSKTILTDFMISDFSKINVGKLNNNQISVAPSERKGLVLTSAGSDPFITGIIPAISETTAFEKNAPVNIDIKFFDSNGPVQVFYLLPGQETYTEENSVRKTLSAAENTVSLNLSAFPKDIRIDCDAPKVEISAIHFSNPVNPNSILPEVPNQQLKNIPRVWGEKADSNVFDKVKKLEYQLLQPEIILSLDTQSNLKQPMYLFTEFKSDEVINVRVNLYDKTNVKRGEYTFLAEKGLHQYALRLSTNYYWWNSAIAKITLSADKAIAIDKFAIISSNGSFQKSSDSSTFTLSNITDEYWEGGVGLKMNVLLMGKSPVVLKVLANAKTLEFSDGSIMHIKKYTEAGDYIHIEMEEQVGLFKASAAYPNNIKIK